MSIKKITSPQSRIGGNIEFVKSLVLLVVMIITASHSFAQAHFEVIDGLRYLIDENAKEAALVAQTDVITASVPYGRTPTDDITLRYLPYLCLRISEQAEF